MMDEKSGEVSIRCKKRSIFLWLRAHTPMQNWKQLTGYTSFFSCSPYSRLKHNEGWELVEWARAWKQVERWAFSMRPQHWKPLEWGFEAWAIPILEPVSSERLREPAMWKFEDENWKKGADWGFWREICSSKSGESFHSQSVKFLIWPGASASMLCVNLLLWVLSRKI